MPGHHHHGYADEWYWEDLPESARKAATLLGYTRESWDAAEAVAYHNKTFNELTSDEKRAAVYLGRNPLDFILKDVKWDTITDTMRKHATNLGWNQDKWDKNWPVRDVDISNCWWKDMSPEQTTALEYFGYNQNMWDGIWNDEQFDGSAPSVSAAKPNEASTTSSNKEKKDDDGKHGSNKKDDGDKKQTKKNRVPFSQSPAIGGTGGAEFDHGNHLHIDEITVAADSNMVHGISIKYMGKECKEGSIGKDNVKTFKLRNGEFITSVKVTTSNKLIKANNAVTSITFFTNRGAKLGPCGEEKSRKEELIKAPDGAVLCGLHGKAGRHINAIGFKWGPNSKA